jgi:hypothetical protein
MLYLSCYKLAAAYSTLSILYRTAPDTDVPAELQVSVAIESAIALLQDYLSAQLSAREDFEEDFLLSTPVTKHESALDAGQNERAQMLLLRLHDFGSTCIVGKTKGEDEHLCVPGQTPLCQCDVRHLTSVI